MSVTEVKKENEKALNNCLKEMEELILKQPCDRESLLLKIEEMRSLCKAHGEILRLSAVMAFEYLPLYADYFNENVIRCFKGLRKNFYEIWKETKS